MSPRQSAIFRAIVASLAAAALFAAVRLLASRPPRPLTAIVLLAMSCALLPLCLASAADLPALRTLLAWNLIPLAALALFVQQRLSMPRDRSMTIAYLIAVLSLGMLSVLPKVTPSLHSLYEEQIRQTAAQQERNRLARDLHDSIKQQIFAIQAAAAAAQARFDSDTSGAREALESVRSSAREAMAEMEAMLDQLRAAPLESIGLIEALRKQCEALKFRTGAHVEAELSPVVPPAELRPGAAQALFRIAQEALSNIARHARATQVQVTLGPRGSHYVLTVQDNGSGFDEDGVGNSGMGLAGMKSRATEQGGAFSLTSRPGEGTRLLVDLPLSAHRSLDPKIRGFGIAAALTAGLSLLIPNPHFASAARGFAIGLLISALGQFFVKRRDI
jgi:signal transduction histidine kinase